MIWLLGGSDLDSLVFILNSYSSSIVESFWHGRGVLVLLNQVSIGDPTRNINLISA